MQKSCRRNVPPISFSFRSNTGAPDPVSLSSDLLYLAGTELNSVCTPNVTSNVMRRSASNSFPAAAFRSTRHGRSGTTFALVPPPCHHLPPRVADQMVGVACCLRRLRAAWATPSSSRPRLPKWHPPGTPALDEAPAKLPEMASSEESGVWTQDLSVHEDAAVGSESPIRGAGHHEGTQLRHGILGD